MSQNNSWHLLARSPQQAGGKPRQGEPGWSPLSGPPVWTLGGRSARQRPLWAPAFQLPLQFTVLTSRGLWQTVNKEWQVGLVRLPEPGDGHAHSVPGTVASYHTRGSFGSLAMVGIVGALGP